jgi:hypothetical protein
VSGSTSSPLSLCDEEAVNILTSLEKAALDEKDRFTKLT